MNYVKDKKIDTLMEQALTLLDESNTTNNETIVKQLCDTIFVKDATTHISQTLLDELQLAKWIQQYATTQGGASCLVTLISSPTYNEPLLQRRGDLSRELEIDSQSMAAIKDVESTIFWLLRLPLNIKDAPPLPLLFPTWPVLKHLNRISVFVGLLYIFKVYFMPLMNIAQPLSSVIAPYIYIRRYLKINLKLSSYLSLLRSMCSFLAEPSGNIKKDVGKYITGIVYAALYLYSIYNSFDFASMTRKLKCDITCKWDRIYTCIQHARFLLSQVPDNIISEYSNNTFTETTRIFQLENNIASLYQLITSQSLRDELSTLMRKIYVIDAITSVGKMHNQRGWSICEYGDTTQIWGMGHPLLSYQVRNPLHIQNNLIITGPNAAGKTTYLKAICANIILAQSIGVCCGVKSIICPVHAILTSMSIQDVVGKESLFEAEIRRCSILVNQAHAVHAKGQRALLFLDEPMHSTPPTEGTAMAMAIAEYLGNIPGVKVFLTTHYHPVTSLEDVHTNWMNISMEARSAPDGMYKFPFRIRRGSSTQCIAIELLKERCLPGKIINRAIEMKNKICNSVVANDDN